MVDGSIKKKKRKVALTEEEMDDLAKDIALIKKFKKKKVYFHLQFYFFYSLSLSTPGCMPLP